MQSSTTYLLQPKVTVTVTVTACLLAGDCRQVHHYTAKQEEPSGNAGIGWWLPRV
jgi:ferredoxin-like protein FixX